MFKNIKVSNLVFEMLVEVARQRKPQINPEQFLEKLIKAEYNTTIIKKKPSLIK